MCSSTLVAHLLNSPLNLEFNSILEGRYIRNLHDILFGMLTVHNHALGICFHRHFGSLSKETIKDTIELEDCWILALDD